MSVKLSEVELVVCGVPIKSYARFGPSGSLEVTSNPSDADLVLVSGPVKPEPEVGVHGGIATGDEEGVWW